MHEGFGTRAIKMLIQNQLHGDVHFNWHPTGLACIIDIPFEQPENKKLNAWHIGNVRFGSLADMEAPPRNVRFPTRLAFVACFRVGSHRFL